ncbi:MAG TPA: TetR/AcrR family transcriptional regulator, partial [Pseudonocardiaceae bacterium]
QHIAATALALIAEHGLPGVSMSLLARRAGIARATLYNYFPDLESVLAAVVADQVSALTTRLRHDLDPVTDPAEQLDRTLRTLLGWLARRPRTGNHTDPVGRLSPDVIATLHEPLDRLRELVRDILERGVADSTFDAIIDPALHAEFIIRLLFGLDTHNAGARRRHAIGDQLPRFVLRGLGHDITTVETT